jgi:hypothetical protein
VNGATTRTRLLSCHSAAPQGRSATDPGGLQIRSSRPFEYARRVVRWCGSLGVLGVLLLEGCSGAPSVIFAGAYFPAWLFCSIVAVVVAALIRGVMVATGLVRVVPLQLAVCTSIGILVAVLIWKVWVSS